MELSLNLTVVYDASVFEVPATLDDKIIKH